MNHGIEAKMLATLEGLSCELSRLLRTLTTCPPFAEYSVKAKGTDDAVMTFGSFDDLVCRVHSPNQRIVRGAFGFVILTGDLVCSPSHRNDLIHCPSP
jgi:hypothetical protein